jgi:hypothetical protein
VWRFGADNTIAVRVLDEMGEGGITRKPVRLEVAHGPSPGILLPRLKPFSSYNPMRFRQW